MTILRTRWLPLSSPPAPVAPSQAGYARPFSEPVRKNRTALMMAALVASGGTDVSFIKSISDVRVSSWVTPLSEPARLKPGLRAQDHPAFSDPIFPTPVVVTATIGWDVPLSEPVRSRKLLPSLQHTFSTSPLPIIPSFGWFANLADPVRRRPTAERPAFTLGTLNPIIPSVSGWWKQYTDPVRVRPALLTANQMAFAYGAAPITPVTVDISWWQALSEPLRARPALRTASQSVAAFGPTPIIPNSAGWWQPFSEPVRTRTFRISGQLAFASEISPIIVPLDGWWQPLSVPIRARRAIQPDQSVTPVQTTATPFQWAAARSTTWARIGFDPSRQQFLAWAVFTPTTPAIIGIMSAIETKDILLGAAMSWNQATSAEIGVIDTSVNFGTEIGVIPSNASGSIASVSISISLV